VHAFVSTHATECCVVFDVLLPPYSSSSDGQSDPSDTEVEARAQAQTQAHGSREGEGEGGGARRVCTYYAVDDGEGRVTVEGEEEKGRLVTLCPVPPSGALPVGVVYDGFKPVL
jgi:hypothetical protein